MDNISYIHKSVELFFQILRLVEVWTHRSMELSPNIGVLRRRDRACLLATFRLPNSVWQRCSYITISCCGQSHRIAPLNHDRKGQFNNPKTTCFAPPLWYWPPPSRETQIFMYVPFSPILFAPFSPYLYPFLHINYLFKFIFSWS